MSGYRRVTAIVNPRARRTTRVWPRHAVQLATVWPQFDVVTTGHTGHATQATRDALEAGADAIVSVGGDGTNNEVLAGFLDRDGHNRFPDAALLVLPTGTGCDLRRVVARGQADALALVKAPTIRVDYGWVEFTAHDGHTAARPFLNVCSFGISGLVDRYVQTSPAGGYVGAAVRAIAKHRPALVRVRVDDGPPRDVVLDLLVVANGQYFGGGMWVCPSARLNDGLFDTVTLAGLGRTHLMRMLAKVFYGRHVDDPAVAMGHARRITLEPVDPDALVLLDLDGEQPGGLPARIEIRPAALELGIG